MIVSCVDDFVIKQGLSLWYNCVKINEAYE